MDTKITLSFDEDTIKKAKAYAKSQNISLSRLTEFLYRQIISGDYRSLEELPIADWVDRVAEGEPEYRTKPRSRKAARNESFEKKNKK
ncbi:hypothetical protein SAMN02927921_01830 [Sinomicrobium oceani]|uniref:Ribbon-helix-helix protein, copG family n=1 Tax=Sinomicrobium oceani TaxID=1150368 RepID=A0A1K1PK44_9FLAO|nr:DUF6364 family protein [Sinomicrobium oceani]SFW47825.1 hypothetical protein SAMN02927921_01830 [Sinomicrobium oceani]